MGDMKNLSVKNRIVEKRSKPFLLSQKQFEILRVIREYLKLGAGIPTLEDLALLTKMNTRSSVYYHIKILRARGFIDSDRALVNKGFSPGAPIEAIDAVAENYFSKVLTKVEQTIESKGVSNIRKVEYIKKIVNFS